MFSVKESQTILEKSIKKFPSTLIVLGSGWNKVLESAKIVTEIPYEVLFGVKPSVPGHEGKLIIAIINKQKVALMAGRFHTYEGYTSEEVTRPIQTFAKLGLKQVVLTAAVGALNEKYQVGDFIILSDLITTFCPSPLVGPQFIDMSSCFDGKLRQQAIKSCAKEQIPFHEGIYCYTRGPHFETPAEKMLFHNLGADVIGMSTVPETIMARSLGVRVLGLSYVTNLAFVVHKHEDVLAAAEQGGKRMVRLLMEVIDGN